MEDEIELIQSIKDENSGTELVLSGTQGDERYVECFIIYGDNLRESTCETRLRELIEIIAQNIKYQFSNHICYRLL